MTKKELNQALPWIALGFLIIFIRLSFIWELGIMAIPFELIFLAVVLFFIWNNSKKSKKNCLKTGEDTQQK
jgi:hypothetical protein